MDFLRALGGADVIGQLGQAINSANQLEKAKSERLQQQLMGQEIQMRQAAVNKAREEEARMNAPLNSAALKSMFPGASDEFLTRNVQTMEQMGLGRRDQGGEFVTNLKNVMAYGNQIKQNHELFNTFSQWGLDDVNSQLSRASDKLLKLQQDPGANPEEVQKTTKEVEALRGRVSGLLETRLNADAEYQKKLQLELGKRAADVEKWKAEQAIKVMDRANENQQRHMDRMAERENALRVAASLRDTSDKGPKLSPQGMTATGSVSFDPKTGQYYHTNQAGVQEVYDQQKHGEIDKPGNFTKGKLDDATMEMAYQNFKQFGDLGKAINSIGSKRDPQMISKIANHIAKRSDEEGFTQAAGAARAVAMKGYGASMQMQEKQLRATEQWARTADGLMKVAEEKLDAVNKYDPRILNKWSKYIRGEATGDPDVLQLNALMMSIRTDVNRMLNNPMSISEVSVEARKEMDKKLSDDYSPQGIKGLFDIYRKEMDIRKKALRDEIQATRTDMMDTAPSPGAPSASGVQRVGRFTVEVEGK